MNILVITNMFPSKQKPYSGLFVKNQFEELKKTYRDDSLDCYAMERKFTSKVGSLIKYSKFFLNFIFKYVFTSSKYDIIHVHFFYPTVILAYIYKYLKNKNIKIIVTFHGSDIYQNDGHLYRSLLKGVDKYIVVNSQFKKYIHAYLGKDADVEFLPAGISEIFRPTKITKKYDLIYAGSFYSIKGFDLLAKILTSLNKPLNIAIVGSGPLERLINEDIKRVHNVHLIKNASHEQLLELYNASRFLINTSRSEAFGLSICEAMKCGVPCIATNTDGAKEQVIDGENGFILGDFNEIFDDITPISDLVYKTLDYPLNKYHALSDSAEKSARKWTLPNVCKRLHEIYEEV
ncbi:glycosyltransferase family 4 protein [Kangiella sediminilitoris]|uniref:Glycosyltransferase n=1 Tax=Kangiella sediminilitoris TaxID=1144748 RepID=A0A1B3BBJ6_9GAMM|nr:glycosyltransferase family 4 protein [Kangiella sediminilitoris]AOE50161.1 Glycosyltransferase [Kangiella sediminilitoris]